jgi:predicted alpha-1,2-mannosidase
MNKIFLIGAAVLLASCSRTGQEEDFSPVDYVSTLVGTESTYNLSTGNTYPAVARPWGMNFWTPQTGADGDGWAYTYTATKIRGLKQTHQPSPWINDYGEFSIMPVTKGSFDEPTAFGEEGRASWFSHKSETAKPYYYSVYLADHDVLAEMTATSHAAVLRFTYPEKDTSFFVLDAYDGGSYIKVDQAMRRLEGFTTRNSGGVGQNFRNWFIIESDTPFDVVGTFKDGKFSTDPESDCDHAVAVVGFKTSKGQKVNLRVASSFISPAQAKLNLDREVGKKNFDEVEDEGRKEWNEILGRIKVEDGNTDDMRTFYSCLYRCLLFPRSLGEVNSEGRLVHYSPLSDKIEEGEYLTDTGFWDTFRALLPLMNLVYPERGTAMLESLRNYWKESGFLPEWASPGHRSCMVGNNSASVLADAYLTGASCDSAAALDLWNALVHDAHSSLENVPSTGRLGWEYYDSLGYIPDDVGINEDAARTLEYAYDDWCIYRFGKAIGRPDSETAPYKASAMNYAKLYNPEHSLMQGRHSDGTFAEDFSPFKWGGDFTEGNSLHYTWSVFHDIQGLSNLMGGDAAMEAMLDTVFALPPVYDDSYYGFPIHEIIEMTVMDMGNYAHGNQPIQHMLYLYDYVSKPWKTQARVREVMKKFYTSAPDGYCGDEDNGQTSAWYVFSALGFYPVTPASGQYAIGSPLFRKVVITRPSGEITITAEDNSESNVYVQGLSVNGSEWNHNYLNFSDFTEPAMDISFTMGAEPDTLRGTAPEDKPYSLSTENK